MTVRERTQVAAPGPALARRIGELRYKLWFENHTKFIWNAGVLTVGVPNRHFEEWLQKTFQEAVRYAACEVFGNTEQVRFIIDPELFQAARQEQAEAQNTAPPAPAPHSPWVGGRGAGGEKGEPADASPVAPNPCPPKRGRREKCEGPTLFDRPAARPARRWRKLDEFVVGACNRVAHAAALSVIEQADEGGNPLVLHGPVGTGKTHLLEGVYVGFRRARPDWRALFVTAEDFTNRFVQAMRQGKLGGFRKRFRECDVLLLDDLQFLATKKATRAEFLHTFDCLRADGKPVILTCDCHPRLADEFPADLTDRLLGGAVWSLAPPDADTRLAMLRAKAARSGEPPIAEDVLRYLAGQLRGNVRELEGALHSLRHYGRASGRPIDVAVAREALGDLLRHAVRVVQLSDVDEAVCRVLRLPSGALQSEQRAWAVSHPRMVAMFLARKHTTSAYSEIGEYFGGRNHSTVVAAERKVRCWLEGNGELAFGERTFGLREVVELAERELLK